MVGTSNSDPIGNFPVAHPGHARRWRWRPVAAFAAALLVVPASAGAQPRSSEEVAEELDRAEREADRLGDDLGQVTSDIQTVEGELATLAVELDDARGRLRAAEGQVALAEAALEEATEEQRRAEADHRRAEGILERTEELLVVEEAVLADQLVESFKYGTVGATRGAMVLEVLRRADDPNAFAVGLKQLRVVVDTQESTVERVFDLRQERTQQAEEAARARGRAAQAAAEAADTLEFVEQMRGEAEALTVEIADKEARQRTVLASLEGDAEDIEASLARVESETTRLSRELADRRAAEEAERRAAEEARNRSAGGAGPSVDGGYCPVVGAVAGRDFTNDWGWPRSGGRSHQGTDVFADRGVPVVAVADGVVVRSNPLDRGLGGITVTYRTADGSEWYNAHLATIAPGMSAGASIAAGQQIGTVGNSGNARTTPPHLHIQRHYGGSWVNPYPTIAPLCR
ncbi:MAG TPA: peptidoglycan DD-metalloendopeptidase family protein [Egicoccus sp.]|nr:peptidoglycan DD-metalloendopeptidase family protein [Egicoccus sp.]HSK23699.1 peptidoglycan DD-metalloendopeptidase family protein [Egicoccus sp.]